LKNDSYPWLFETKTFKITRNNSIDPIVKKSNSVMNNLTTIQKKYVTDLKRLFLNHKSKPDNLEIYSAEYQYADFMDLKKTRDKGKIYVKSIVKIQSDLVEHVILKHFVPRNGRNNIHIIDSTGYFKVTFSNNNILFYVKWKEKDRFGDETYSLFATERKTWIKLSKTEPLATFKRSKPPSKFPYRLRYNQSTKELEYIRLKKIQTNDLAHPSIPEAKKDIEFFFNNIKQFTKYNMPGARKVLLIGEPGTGKSSFCAQIAREYGKEMLVVFGTDIYEIADHVFLAAKHNLKTIAVLEDADSSLWDASSSILNFLDGIDQPINRKGAYIIFTTNFPQKIEPRIIKRPGRIDKIFHFNALEGNYALECANIYFSDIKDFHVLRTENLTELETIFSGLTGAQIKELSFATSAYLANTQSPMISIQALYEVKKVMMDSIKAAQKLAREDSLSDPTIGF
jgi:SpoVK/Ycf46/Vps4 family AAA+-type ATPase